MLSKHPKKVSENPLSLISKNLSKFDIEKIKRHNYND